MIESGLFALVLLLLVYCCWIAHRASKKSDAKASDLGLIAFKENKKDVGK